MSTQSPRMFRSLAVVVAFLAQAGYAAAQLPRVLIITTGGTLGLSGTELTQAVPQLAQIADIKVEEFVRVGSSSIRPTHWIGLSRRINQAFAADRGLAGIIVTHGTDTMEETAFFLHLTVKDERPVVVTGAMRGPTAISADGPANTVSAVKVAVAPRARGLGVLVVLNDWIHSARDVRKTDSNRVDTFRSEWGPLGVVDADRVVFQRSLITRHTTTAEFALPADTTLPDVPIVADYSGNDGSAIRALADKRVAGIVVQAFANGRASPGATQAMRDVAAAGIPVVLTSRVPEGRVMDREGAIITAGDFSPQRARVLLMLALSRTKDPAELRRIFTSY
jgi:L-asparaginase